MPLYTCRTSPDGFTFAKFDDNLWECEAIYTVSTCGRFCDCPAGHRQNCKHREMLIDFRAANAIDSGRFYNPTTQNWQATIRVELQPEWRRI